MEDEVRIGDSHPNFVHAFNAFAPAGDVTGEVSHFNLFLFFGSAFIQMFREFLKELGFEI